MLGFREIMLKSSNSWLVELEVERPFRQENEEDEMVALASQVLGDVIPRVYGKVWGCFIFLVCCLKEISWGFKSRIRLLGFCN